MAGRVSRVESNGALASVEGLRELTRQLRTLEGATADLKDVNGSVAALVANASAARAPRRTGRLAASIRGNRAVGRVQVRGGGARVPYAGPIHWGWPARGIEENPFVYEAAAATEPVWLPMYERAVADLVARVSA